MKPDTCNPSNANSSLSDRKDGTGGTLYPVATMTRSDKEQLLHQHGMMIWFTGLSGSGKSTIALGVERELHRRGLLCRILDGDNIRTGINAGLSFSPEDRRENIRRIAEVGKLFVDTGIITLAAFVSPTNEYRQLARNIIGNADFFEIYVSTPLQECERRDVKGLYARARRGEIKDFTGISAPFEAPLRPALDIDTSQLPLQESVRRVLQLIDNIQQPTVNSL
ncbi:MAG: adenylyl-sulfate kinase [Bacteroidaceae bacterium]|nr:adenylyl-sulfate kinase [Bacteroidaceae bacterium]